MPVSLPVPDDEGVWLGEVDAVSVGVVVGLLLSEVLAVYEAEVPIGRDEVCEALIVELALRVLLADTEMLGVSAPVLVTNGVPILEGVAVGVPLAVPLLLSELLPVMEESAPELRDVVCDTLTVELAGTVLLAVIEQVPVPVGVPVQKQRP